MTKILCPQTYYGMKMLVTPLSEQTEFEDELSRTKELILKSEHDWDSNVNAAQISLVEVNNEGV